MSQAVVDDLIATLAKWHEVTDFEQAVGSIDRLCGVSTNGPTPCMVAWRRLTDHDRSR